MKQHPTFSRLALLLLGGGALSLLFSTTELLAQYNNDSAINCAPSWPGGGVVDMGEIADPNNVTMNVQAISFNANCKSGFFFDQGNVAKAHGAYCLAIVVKPGETAVQRQLKNVSEPGAPSLNFHFTHTGNTTPNFAVGNADGDGLGISYHGISSGSYPKGTTHGPYLDIGTTGNDLGIYIHPSSGQPANLRAGEYEASFSWRLYAGGDYSPPTNSGAPDPTNCAQTVGRGVGAYHRAGIIKVKVKVGISCTLKLPQPGNLIDFGTWTSGEIAAGVGPITRTIEVGCNNNNDMFITMDGGLHSGGNINNRHMKLDGGTDMVKYNLTKPGGGEWGDAANTGSGHRVTASMGMQSIPVQAYIPPQAGSFASGEYKDKVHVQLWN